MTLDEHPMTDKRNIWLRGLLMLLMAMIYQVCGTLLFLISVIQFLIALLSGSANARLQTFGRSLGNFLRQIVNFLSFASEDLPFPFDDWPAAE